MAGEVRKKIGVLALQGDFEAHSKALARAGAEPVEVRSAADLQHIDGLVIPGGESSTMLKLLEMEDMLEPLREFGRAKPVFGTCAGAILLANEVVNPAQQSLGLMDIAVERNAYGRQLDSRIARLKPEGLEGDLEAVFIRAPIIRRVGANVKVLARYQGDPVLVEQGRHLVATFHPELTDDQRVHRLFLSKV
ncbi:MAG TPA: pyridoxal 5'-phosphate synthase glutaminase subunit PdxT [Bryobacteraceae bacterium]|nr:pyridoxal 5'-phosphate synthase glutaminase subunit PdxT [Bryobacteraceae bacterium]